MIGLNFIVYSHFTSRGKKRGEGSTRLQNWQQSNEPEWCAADGRRYHTDAPDS